MAAACLCCNSDATQDEDIARHASCQGKRLAPLQWHSYWHAGETMCLPLMPLNWDLFSAALLLGACDNEHERWEVLCGLCK